MLGLQKILIFFFMVILIFAINKNSRCDKFKPQAIWLHIQRALREMALTLETSKQSKTELKVYITGVT